MLALCVQVLSRDPRPSGQTERATLSLRAAPQAGHGGAALATGGGVNHHEEKLYEVHRTCC